MGYRFAELAFTPAVRAYQERAGSRASYARLEAGAPARDSLGPDEAAFIAARDSCYMATVSETGWPYVQHRGGAPGFVHVLDGRTLAFADLRGNRQYVSVGNLAGDDRVCLFFMDYPNRRRLKLLGHARVVEAAENPELVERLRPPDESAHVERVLTISVAAFDWNCPQHITPRFSEAEVRSAVAPLHERIAALEARLAAAGPPTDTP
jgi:hypothetical protein